MKTLNLTILKIAGIPVRLHVSWLVLAVLITWSLALGFSQRYPVDEHPGWTAATYWSMAVLTALGLFASLILHELGHALAGRRLGVPFRSITLFIFGGVAEMKEEPRSAKAEFIVAVAGPAVSVFLAVGCGLLSAAGAALNVPVPLVAALFELAVINAVLVGFNAVPAFPLDGGRVFRAILWSTTGDFRRATSISAQVGQALGAAMMFLGVFSVLSGAGLAGLWWMILGWFLHGMAQRSYEEVRIRDVFEGRSVRDFMTADVASVRPELDVKELVEHYVYQQHHKLYPVRSNGHLLGYVTPSEIRKVARDEWDRHRVDEIMTSNLEPVEVPASANAADVLARMQRTGQTRMLVVERDGTLAGIVTLKDLLEYLRLKDELEEE